MVAPVTLPLTYVSLSKHVLMRELDGESVLLNLDSGHYFGLKEVGTRMLTVLCNCESIAAACATLLVEYDVDAEVLRSDLHQLVEKMAKHGLLEVSGEA